MDTGRKDFILDVLYNTVELLSHPVDNQTRENIKHNIENVIKEIEDE